MLLIFHLLFFFYYCIMVYYYLFPPNFISILTYYSWWHRQRHGPHPIFDVVCCGRLRHFGGQPLVSTAKHYLWRTMGCAGESCYLCCIRHWWQGGKRGGAGSQSRCLEVRTSGSISFLMLLMPVHCHFHFHCQSSFIYFCTSFIILCSTYSIIF